MINFTGSFIIICTGSIEKFSSKTPRAAVFIFLGNVPRNENSLDGFRGLFNRPRLFNAG